MEEMIHLRPHHALCIQFFEGKGYSPEFVRNMTEVIDHLKPDIKLKLTISPDLICNACPNIQDEKCNQNSKVISYDKSVLSLCHWKEDQIYTWQEINSKVNDLIIKNGRLHEICGNCSWFSICSQTSTFHEN